MNQGADELSSGLNGRLRPRKSNIPSPQSAKLVRKSDGKTGQDKVKRTSTVSKTPPNKTDDLATKSDSTFLCPYCDKHFASKQTLSKHVRRIHTASSKQDNFIACLFCSHYETETNEIIRHMAGTHPEQYFACLNCHTRFSSSLELAEHKTKSCETKLPYRSRLRQKISRGSLKDTHKDNIGNESKVFSDGHGFNGVVISCELKPSQGGDGADIEDNITTNLILPPSKTLGGNTGIDKSAVIVLDDIQWNKRIPPNFSFHNTDADQILSRLGVVHRSPRTGESTKKDWKNLDESTQKFEKCFDTSFYSKVASNVQENLSKFLDGSFNFNPDPDSTIKTRKSKNSVVINTAEGFPILLASEQYSRNAFDRYMPRAIAPKHKWKWDNLENDKGPINPDQIKRDSHTNNCIISLVSSLDIWTQLCMKRKFEEKFGCPPLEKKTEKQTIISNELKEILESRELPTPSTQVMKLTKTPSEKAIGSEFPSCLGLTPSTSTYELQPAVLSGEWVRPRCYVCCACGAQSRDSRAFSAHVSSQHPNAQVQHYEIVGEQLLNADILKHLYVPPSQMCNRTRPPRGFRECTKCRKSVTLEDLHQHMLDCAGDTPAVRRKCRYRPFGVRRRRPRLPDNTIRKKIRKDIRSRQRPKALMRPRPIRTEVGDAETIRKMIADLPAKRHRVLVNPNNPSLRPRIKQRPKMLMKRRTSEDRNKRKKRNDKESSKTRLGSPINDNMSVMSDDDNKPLKPIVRRVGSKKSAPRRTESEKRKTTMLKRAKLPNRQVKKGLKDESVKDTTKTGCSSKPLITENISIENSSDKIDINTEDFKGREQAGQGEGSSNNREGQRPGCSGQSANSQNGCAPAQNVPLKHSIARLTADSEKHDKSVQFHHLFLVQQECNNVNQHVQSGQQLLFENEAAVLTLDKPPLHYNTKGSLDALQKSKLNKPRKGLNACIAMLKNKLVEPAAESVLPAGHVSVQCGDDEPLYIKPDTALQTPIGLGTDIKSITKPDITHNRGVPHEIGIQHSVDNDIKSSEYTKDKDLKTPSTSGETIGIQHFVDHDKKRSEHTNDKALKTPSISGETIEIQHAVEHYDKRSEYTKGEPLKRLSTSGETIEIQHAVEHYDKRSEYTKDEALKRLSTSDETIGIQHSVDHDKRRSEYAKKKSLKTPSTSGETIRIQHSVDNNKKTSSKEKGLKTPLISGETMKSQKPELIEVTHELGLRRSLVKEDKSIDISSQSDLTNVMVPLEPIAPKAISVTVDTLAQKERKKEVKKPNVEGKKTKRRIKVKDTSKDIPHVKSNKSLNETPQLPVASAVANKSYDTLNRQTSEEKQIIPEHPRPNTINHTTITNEKEQNVKEQCNNVYYGNCLSLQAQADYHSDGEYSRKVNMDNFPSPDFNHLPVNNRPAHASTHVESIVSVPLDLSGKVSNVNTTQDLLNQSYLLSAYDSYETLDLSNKNQDVGSNDEIVDLSIKTSYLKSIENDIIANDNVTDLSLKSCASLDIPTDLTIKKKITNITTNSFVEILDVSERISPQQREVISLDKPSKPQLEDEMGQFVSANVNQLDTKASDITPPVDAEEANLIRKVIKTKEVNTSTSKPENLVTGIPEKASENFIESLPADLSCQQKIEDISKDLSAPTQVNTLKIEQDPCNNQENVSQMHPRMRDKISMQVQKPIYDPTLKIPQYKIRAASSHDNPSSGGVTPNTSLLTNTTSSSSFFASNNSEITPNLTQAVSTVISGAKHTIGIQDELPFAYGTVPLNAPHSNPGSMYGISNYGVTSHLNKVESTTPVYTLATACISVTKIETSNSTTLTNTLLSIPGSTIANTTPVYTLAGTTIVAPIGVQANYSHIVPAIPSNSEMKKTEERIMPGVNIQSKAQEEKELSNHKEKVVNANSMENVEHDPETARKIALLPKELVDVLGNMPVDHRNRLLNILPQYVSTPMADTGLKCDVPNQSESSLNLTTPSETKEMQMPIVLENTQESDPKIMSPVFKAQEENKILHISNTGTQFDLENTPAMPPLLVNPTTLSLHRPINSDDSANTDASYTTQTHRNAKDELKTEVSIKSDVISEDSFSALASNRLSSCHNLSSDKVIDLTEDETVCRSDIPNEPTVEVPPISLIVQPKRNKSNNDQTASLRAVRIKAPSERQKSIDSQLVTYTSVAPVLPNIIHTNEQDNEVEKSLHINVSLNTDMSLAIQQAEVSSTQHSNKNAVAESKFPSVISPNVLESNLDETNNCSLRRLSTASKDESLKIEDSQNTKSGVKTTLVSSSILNNEINKEPLKGNNKKCIMNTDVLDTKYISKDQNMATESRDLTVNNSTSLQSKLDSSESYDEPIQCSTPKPTMMISKQPECLLTSTEDSLPTASEDQEDSDDDLSLAAICKQKQQNLKTDLTTVVTKKNSDILIRKKEKKNKKNVENIKTARVSSQSNNNTVISKALSNDEPMDFIDIDGLSSKLSVNEKPQITPTTREKVKKNNRKLRRKKVTNNLQINSCDMAPKDALTDCDTHNVTVKSKDVEIQITEIVKIGGTYNTVLKDDNKLSVSSSRKRLKINDDIVVNETIKEQSLEKNADALKCTSIIEKQKNRKKKTPNQNTETDNCKITRLASNLDQKNNDISIPSNNNKNLDPGTSSSVCQIRCSDDIRLIDKSEIISDDRLNSKGTNIKEHTTPLGDTVALTPCSSLEETNNMTTPLRRSKRGRSRNNSVTGEESLHTETLQENRTPLTKKQLIFSKLLLDEENNIKNPDGATGEKVNNLRTMSPLKETVQDDIKEPESENIIPEKNKCVKRKKSPHLKRKCKKKKSLCTQSSCEESVDGLHDQVKDVITPQEDLNTSKDNDKTSVDKTINDACTSNPTHALTDAKCIHSDDKPLQVCIEKRKSNELPLVELSHMPKKTKLNITECGSDTKTSQSDRGEKNTPAEKDSLSTKLNATDDAIYGTAHNEKNTADKSNTIAKTTPVSEKPTRLKLNQPDSRTKTCYNMPVAGRRTRSKSAVIKSAVYDPYDIDMDDMIEQAEPLRQRKISSDYKSSNNMKNSSKEVQNMTISKEDEQKIFSQELGPTTPTLDSYSNNDMNDSDDSSKSDIPLKKYVEEKEKKIFGLDESVSIQKKNVENKVDKNKKITNDKDKKLSTDKKNRRTLGVCNSSDGIAQDETEQQLRSEQFMASFGFFSERKPRKSNLLATKKISETFHIIANEPDDMYFNYKDRNSKKSAQNENRKSFERETNLKGTRQRSPLSKKTTKRGRKKKNSTTVAAPTYCHICKKEFRRSDNFLRHQMTLLHVSKMSEVEMKVKTVPVLEEPNYLIAYKEHLDRLKIITDKIKRKKHSKSNPKIAPLSLEEILADVNKIVREQQLSHRGLSCDEELFLDCCELLKESHKKQEPIPDIPSLVKDPDILCSSEPTNVGLDLLGKTDVDVKRDNKNDGDVDSITAKTILESEEVRNLENDLISGLKEAANASNLKKSGIIFQHTVSEVTGHQHDFNGQFSSPPAAESQYEQLNNYEEPAELNTMKSKRYPEFKEKMYPDIEEIDMFEDKFDKIKRKCRSQAAAAKQPQLVIEPSISRKGRKKSEKKKGKKNSKKNHPSTVLTKGALKGFDGIKVSIPTSDINMSAIVSPLETSRKKKKKGDSKKRRENKISESSSKYDSDHNLNENPASLKNVDVYEFMDNEDVELFEFRPSTLMERFKSISNKDIPSTSKASPVVEEPDNSSTSASDGDDFVYMSDDYVCSDDETENSLMSCDVTNTKISTDIKKLSSQMKKRDAIEKNAVMGKIFKNNAVRSEKKITKNKEPAKPKANLDQLFDSLLEDEPSSSMLNDESLPLKEETPCASKYGKRIASPSRSDELSSKYDEYHSKNKYNNLTTEKEDFSPKYKNLSSENDDEDDDDEEDDDDDDADRAGASYIDYGPSTSKLCLKSFMGDHRSTKPDLRPSLSPPELKPVSPKKYDHTSSKQLVSDNKNDKKSFHLDNYFDFQGRNSKNTATKRCDSKSPIRKTVDGASTSSDYNDTGDPSFTSDETGVARQRARRKCTVGKQNILAETWSSESEPDGGPPRPNSAESIASGTTRKKKGKKKDSQHTGGRRTNNRHISFKKQEIESRVTSSNRNTTTHTSGASSSGVVDDRSTNSALGSFASDRSEPSTSAVGTSGGSCKFVIEPPATPSTSSRASPTPSTSAGPSTSTGCATSDPEDGTFLVPAEPGSSSGSKHRPLYYWSGKDGTEAQAREAQAREQLAREEQARQQRAREEQARQELARRELERAEQARKEKEREERAREDEAQQQQQQQQHGWIVGDSHKKLVTMLAHAKGRKRNNNDDKRHKTE